MITVTCGWCDVEFSTTQSTAKYCCRQHMKNAASKRHRERNPNYFARYSKSPRMVAYVETHKEERRTYARDRMRALRAANPDTVKEYNREWFRANSDKHVEYNRARRARKLAGSSTGVSPAEWARIKNRQLGKCFYCNKKVDLTQDHVVPLTRGGAHSPGNIVGACHSCNSSKNNSFIVEWKRRGGYQMAPGHC